MRDGAENIAQTMARTNSVSANGEAAARSPYHTADQLRQLADQFAPKSEHHALLSAAADAIESLTRETHEARVRAECAEETAARVTARNKLARLALDAGF